MRFRAFALVTPLALLASCGGQPTSQASKLEVKLSLGDTAKIMHERHEGMETIGKSSKALNRELGGATPNLAIIRASADKIANLSRQATNWFPAGTGPEAGNTGAKPEIWQQPQDFAVKLSAFQKAALAFDGVARGNDVGSIKRQFAQLGPTCKACHDKYRKEMKH